MSKSIKFENEVYWDTSSITHNKELLSTKVINSSGNGWIKYEDGTMIQYDNFTYSGATNVALPYGGYRTLGRLVTLPTSFLNTNYFIIASVSSDLNNYGFCVNKTEITKNSFNGFWWTINKNSTNLTHSIDYLAIGKWK